MRFSSRRNFGLIPVVLLWGTLAAAGGDGNIAEVEVLVYDGAQISQSVLHQAEIEAGRIFRAAGVEVTWANCVSRSALADDACHHFPASHDFVLHIVPTGKTSTDLVFGLSFLDKDGAGRYSDVFFDRIEEAHRAFGVNLARLLGAVTAHELGHLLLGSHAHSHMGIMTPHWEGETLRVMNMGSLLFTREQASRMQARIERETGRRNDFRLASLDGRAPD
jgi:hypothetical protein